MTLAYVGLGSNLGERDSIMRAALVELDSLPQVKVERVSSFVENPAVGGPPGQPAFLNACAELRTSLAPSELLFAMHAIEQRHGRRRGEAVRDGPRTLDLDLLLYGSLVIDRPDLCVPHPRLEQRWFVLKPLAQLIPMERLPRSGLSVSEALERVEREARTSAARG